MDTKALIAVIMVAAVVGIGAAVLLTTQSSDYNTSDDYSGGGSGDSTENPDESTEMFLVKYTESGSDKTFTACSVDELSKFMKTCKGKVTVDLLKNVLTTKGPGLKVGSDITDLTFNLNGFMLERNESGSVAFVDVRGGLLTVNGGDKTTYHECGYYDVEENSLRNVIIRASSHGGCLSSMLIDVDGGTVVANDVSFLVAFNNPFSTNGKGAALDAENCSITLNGCYVSGCCSTGGSFNLDDNVNLYLNNTTFQKNYCYDGGAIYVNGDNVNILGNNATMDGNEADEYMKYVFWDEASYDGGAIFVDGDYCSISGVSFNSNYSNDQGSAIYVNGANCTINNCKFSKNIAGEEGTIYVDAKHCKITDCSFTDNKSEEEGIIYLSYYSYDSDSKTVIERCTFTGNTPVGKDAIAGMGDDEWIGSVKIDGVEYTADDY